MAREALTGLRKKVRAVLADTLGEVPDRDPSAPASVELREAIQKAFKAELDEKSSSDLWFHLTDWAWDLEFLVAFYCRPDKFTPAQIREGLTGFLLHAPNHIAEAARIAGLNIEDFWKIPSPSKPDKPDRPHAP